MIWIADDTADTRQSSLVTDIASDITRCCSRSEPLDMSEIEEMAKAVEHYLRQDERVESIDADYLMMLTSQVLSSVGHDDAARRLVLFGTGLVRPSEWEATGKESVWILDLRRMTVQMDTVLEIVVMQSLNIVIDALSDIWDEYRGEGILGLRHVCRTASTLLGVDMHDKAAVSLTNEILGLCTDKLSCISKKRDWTGLPRVMNLDF